MKRPQLVGIVVSLLAFGALWLMPTPAGLTPTGQRALAVTMFTVAWWIFAVMPPAYTTLLLFLGFILLKVAPPEVVFAAWTQTIVWLIFSTFLIAAAVTKSGLARRIAYFFMSRFAASYTSMVVLVYLLGFVLSLLIPHPFPRTLLIMAIVTAVIDGSGMSPKDATALGFATFTGATATAMLLVTGDAPLNLAAVAFSGHPLSWLGWVEYMFVPGIVATLLFFCLQMLLFRPSHSVRVDRMALQQEYAALGPMTATEKKTLFWVLVALALWATDFLHGIDAAWIGLAVAVALAMPGIGGILNLDDVSTGVNWPILIFSSGALCIGAVARHTGLAAWVAQVLLPAAPPANDYLLALLVGGATMVLHMFLGSAMAVLSIVAPPMVAYATGAGRSGLFPALIVYTGVNLHYLLPFQHVTVLVGAGKVGRYGNRETLRFGVPLTLLTLLVMLAEVAWWQMTGLISR